MKHRAISAILSAVLLALTGLLQTASAQTPEARQTATAPVAFIYVSSAPTRTGKHVVQAYAAAPSGELTKIPGSPFHDDVGAMAVNGKYFFGNTSSNKYIAQFLIQPNGALSWVHSTNVAAYDTPGCISSLGPLILDHTGSTIYEYLDDFLNCGSDVAQSFAVEKPSGNLKYLGADPNLGFIYLPFSFIGNNKYAYAAECDIYDHEYVPQIYGFERQTNGFTSHIGINAPFPTTPDPERYLYCPALTAADPANHVAISFQQIATYTDENVGTPQLATYTADTSGNLSTASTSSNMPKTDIQYISDLRMSPSGKLLAVAGSSGLQIFHFNGAGPLTRYTGLLTNDEIAQAFWDHDNHLYAISQVSEKLYVFTITPTSVSQAPGSPYSVPGPLNVVVQPR